MEKSMNFGPYKIGKIGQNFTLVWISIEDGEGIGIPEKKFVEILDILWEAQFLP